MHVGDTCPHLSTCILYNMKRKPHLLLIKAIEALFRTSTQNIILAQDLD